MDNLTWLIIANASKARIYSLHKARFYQTKDYRDLKFIAEYQHADSRKKGSDLVTDKLGEFTGGTMGEQNDPKHREAEHFAHEIVTKLDAAHREKHYRDLIVVAPDAFLGLLNKFMSPAVDKSISLRIEKDYTGQNDQQLVTNLQDHL